MLCVNGRHMEAFSRLNEALQSGVRLEDVNRTALTRIKSGVEAVGIAFPYEVPKKRVTGSSIASGRSSSVPASVVDEEEDHQETRCLSPMLE